MARTHPWEVSDEWWVKVQPLIPPAPPHAKGGRPRMDDRRAFAVFYMEQGGDIFKLSREMGHSDVQVTRLYLESFGSRQARRDHNSFSPVSLLKLNKRAKPRRRET